MTYDPNTPSRTSGFGRSAYSNWYVSAGGTLLPPPTAGAHTHPQSEIVNLTADLAAKAATTHGHAQADVTGLVSALAGKAASFHTHAQSEVVNLASDLAGKAAASHTHAQADIANLLGDMAGKAAASHTHAAADVTSGVMATARLGTGTPTGLTFLRGDGVWAAPVGGSDPWTYVKLALDFTTGNATATAVTGLAFTPIALTDYAFDAWLMLRTATATVGARPGLDFPTGMTDQAWTAQAPNSNTAIAIRNEGTTAGQFAAGTGLPATTQSYLGYLWGVARAGAAPSGNIQVTLASETGGTNVTVRAGSFIRYRTV